MVMAVQGVLPVRELEGGASAHVAPSSPLVQTSLVRYRVTATPYFSTEVHAIPPIITREPFTVTAADPYRTAINWKQKHIRNNEFACISKRKSYSENLPMTSL